MIPSIYNTSRPERKGYNKILYEQHKERIQNMLPTIDNSIPKKLPINHNKIRERINRAKQIDKDNIKLLHNLAKIIQNSSIDNKLSKHVEDTRLFKKHLINVKRKQLHRKITNENLQLLDRIRKVPPTLNFIKNC